MAQQTALSVMAIPGMVRSFVAKSELAVPTIPGLEWTMPENRMHYEPPINRMHYAMPENRIHFTMPEED
ncbi:MAG TPA: hypothetical protein ENH78_02150 [Phycisphaerae bacterium]|nr:hypothetical protein [Phycisphaerae bacterium]